LGTDIWSSVESPVKVKGRHWYRTVAHLRAAEHHLPYRITLDTGQCILP